MNVKISELKDRVGTVIPGIQGTIRKVFPAKEGKGEHGAWKLQNIILNDELGAETQVTLSGCQTMDESYVGNVVSFQSKGTKFGLKGVSVEKRSYEDKNGVHKEVIGVKITKTAQFIGRPLDGVQDSPEEPSHNDDFTPARPTPQGAKPPMPSKEGKSPSERIKQFELLYDICFASAQNTNAVVSVTSQELIKDIATTFFISAMKEGLADKMEVEEHDAF